MGTLEAIGRSEMLGDALSIIKGQRERALEEYKTGIEGQKLGFMERADTRAQAMHEEELAKVKLEHEKLRKEEDILNGPFNPHGDQWYQRFSPTGKKQTDIWLKANGLSPEQNPTMRTWGMFLEMNQSQYEPVPGRPR